MATANDIKFRALAKKLIAKFGVSTGNGKINRPVRGAYDKATGEITVTNNEQIIPMSPPVRYKKKDINGTTIQSDDFKVYIAGSDWDDAFPGEPPRPDEIVTINNIVVRILDPGPIYSGDLVAAYAIHCRKGSADNAE